MMLQAKYFVDTKRYQDEEAVIQDALRHLLRARPELRVQMAVFRYQHEGISLAKATSHVSISSLVLGELL